MKDDKMESSKTKAKSIGKKTKKTHTDTQNIKK